MKKEKNNKFESKTVLFTFKFDVYCVHPISRGIACLSRSEINKCSPCEWLKLVKLPHDDIAIIAFVAYTHYQIRNSKHSFLLWHFVVFLSTDNRYIHSVNVLRFFHQQQQHRQRQKYFKSNLHRIFTLSSSCFFLAFDLDVLVVLNSISNHLSYVPVTSRATLPTDKIENLPTNCQ